MKKQIICLACLLLVGCQNFTAPDYSKSNPDRLESKTLNLNESIKTEQGTEVISGVVLDVTDANEFRLKVEEDVLVDGVGLNKGEMIVVRMLLSQAPERMDQLPFGEEAYALVYDLLMGQSVELEFEPGHVQDALGNYVAYTYLDDYRIQDLLIENGFAKLDTTEFTSIYQDEFEQLEQIAIKNSKGIWAIPGYATVEEGFNALILNSSNFTKAQLDSLEKELISNGNTLKNRVFEMIGTEAPE